jgi:hypothetical protein
MWDFLESIENSGFATYVRETPTWPAYSTVLALHTFGMAFLVGLSGVIALRVLGVVPELPLNPLKKLQPAIVIGFWVNAITGLILTTLAIRSLLANWDFYVKLVAIAFAVVSLVKMRHYAFGDSVPDDVVAAPEARRWAKAMLFFWGLAVLGGRLTAYATNIRMQSAAAVAVGAAILLLLARFVVRHSRPAKTTRDPVTTSQSVTVR